MPAMASATTAPPRPSTAVPVLLSALPGLLTLVLSPVVGVVGLLPSPLSPSPSPGLVGAFCRGCDCGLMVGCGGIALAGSLRGERGRSYGEAR